MSRNIDAMIADGTLDARLDQLENAIRIRKRLLNPPTAWKRGDMGTLVAPLSPKYMIGATARFVEYTKRGARGRARVEIVATQDASRRRICVGEIVTIPLSCFKK